MPHGRIEPTGCCENHGRVQVRFSLFLKPGEKRYDEYYLNLPIMPEGGYPGKLDNTEESQDAYKAWIDALPHEWVNTPFHNHFETFEADVTDKEIEQELKEVVDEFWAIWRHNENISDGWVSRGQRTACKERTPERIAAVEARVVGVKGQAEHLQINKSVSVIKDVTNG